MHYGEIDENINDMTFIPYSNALIAAGQSGLYLVDLGKKILALGSNFEESFRKIWLSAKNVPILNLDPGTNEIHSPQL